MIVTPDPALRVLFLASEVAPYAKTGGLADVGGALPGVLQKLGAEVRVGLPFYQTIRQGGFPMERVFTGLKVPVGGQVLDATVYETQTADGVRVNFFDAGQLFDRPRLYGTPDADYSDNLQRFTFFCRAALLFAKEIGFRCDVVNCHDWQTGLVPAYLKTIYKDDPFFSRTASIFTIHNMAFQGVFPARDFGVCGLPAREFNIEGVEYWGNISLLKAGMVYADAISTVSVAYSREIQTPEFGFGLDGVLRKRSSDIYGILNGADYSEWDPALDSYILAHYDSRDISGKQRCKRDLIDRLGLSLVGSSLIGLDCGTGDRPLLCMMSRLTAQKGYDLLLPVIDDLIELGVSLVVAGEGDSRYEQALLEASLRHVGLMAVRFCFDEQMAHRILAGADMLLMPSLFEPCGLTQIYAMRYGTVPIVRATGGLDDTVEKYEASSASGTGFKFSPCDKKADKKADRIVDPKVDSKALLAEVQQAVNIYRSPNLWLNLMKNGMQVSFSKEDSGQKYMDLYRKVADQFSPYPH